MSRNLVLPVVVVVLVAAGGVGWWLWQRAQADAAVEAVFAEVEQALTAPATDAREWSRLVARLDAIQGRPERVALLRARIELARGRPERAAEHLGPFVQTGAATLEASRLAAAIWLQRVARIGKSAEERRALSRQAMQFAEAAAAEGGTAADEFVAWQAARRAGAEEAERQHAGALQQQHADSLEARTVAAIGAVESGTDQEATSIDALAAEWEHEPVELQVLRGMVLLARSDFAGAATLFDRLLEEAPNLVEVRNWAAAAHHAAGFPLPAGDPERKRHLDVRDTQLEWLDANAPLDDARRPKWIDMRRSR